MTVSTEREAEESDSELDEMIRSNLSFEDSKHLSDSEGKEKRDDQEKATDTDDDLQEYLQSLHISPTKKQSLPLSMQKSPPSKPPSMFLFSLHLFIMSRDIK